MLRAFYRCLVRRRTLCRHIWCVFSGENIKLEVPRNFQLSYPLILNYLSILGFSMPPWRWIEVKQWRESLKIGGNYTMKQFVWLPYKLFEDPPILIRMCAPVDRFDALRPGRDVETRPETGDWVHSSRIKYSTQSVCHTKLMRWCCMMLRSRDRKGISELTQIRLIIKGKISFTRHFWGTFSFLIVFVQNFIEEFFETCFAHLALSIKLY